MNALFGELQERTSAAPSPRCPLQQPVLHVADGGGLGQLAEVSLGEPGGGAAGRERRHVHAPDLVPAVGHPDDYRHQRCPTRWWCWAGTWTRSTAAARARAGRRASDDDASGIASLTEVIRAAMAMGYRPARTVKFMGYAAEEVGLKGSKEIALCVQEQRGERGGRAAAGHDELPRLERGHRRC